MHSLPHYVETNTIFYLIKIFWENLGEKLLKRECAACFFIYNLS